MNRCGDSRWAVDRMTWWEEVRDVDGVMKKRKEEIRKQWWEDLDEGRKQGKEEMKQESRVRVNSDALVWKVGGIEKQMRI